MRSFNASPGAKSSTAFCIVEVGRGALGEQKVVLDSVGRLVPLDSEPIIRV